MRNQVRRDIETQFGRIVEDPQLYAVLLAAYENSGFEAVKCIDFRKVHVVSAPLRPGMLALPLRRLCNNRVTRRSLALLCTGRG